MSVNKEKWIDLIFLTQAFSFEDGMIRFIYDEGVHRIFIHNQTSVLRRALREVGFKITKIGVFYDEDKEPEMLMYNTNIPEALFRSKRAHFDDWADEVTHHYYSTPPSSECDEESESDSDDPVAEK